MYMFVVGEELVARGRFARPDSYGDTMLCALCKKAFGRVAHAYILFVVACAGVVHGCLPKC